MVGIDLNRHREALADEAGTWRLAMPYRILCNGTFQKSQEARPGLGLVSHHFKSLHNDRYDVRLAIEIAETTVSPQALGNPDDVVKELAGMVKTGNGDFSPSLVIHMLMFNIEAIFKFAESPIERIFLNSLNFIAFPYKEVFIQFTHAPIDHSEIDSRSALEKQKEMVEIWERFQNIFDENAMKEFLHTFDELGFSEDMKNQAIFYLLTEYISRLYGMYYITLQPTFKDVRIGGRVTRPDIYVWNPYDPNFRLIVECDGYLYHADKSTFSLDRTRDRILQMRGFKVLRFSGSDIVNNPAGMAKELHEYLVTQKRGKVINC
jgi:hypothetical protein